MTAAASGPATVVVGLDAGTTGVKACAFEPRSSWRCTVVREYPLLEPAPDQYVQDPATILGAAREALAGCVTAVSGAEVLGVSVSAGMHGLLALDAEGHPLTPLVTWADCRSRDEARALRDTGQARDLHRRTGVPVHSMSPLIKLRWFARHEPELLRSARWWVGLKELLLHWLTGEMVTELSSASGTGLLDMAARSWSPEAVEVAGVDLDRLPPIVATTTVYPMAAGTAGDVGLPAGTPVVVGAADGPLGNLGTGALSPGVAGLSLGTSGAVRVAVDSPRVDEDGSLFCYALTDDVWVVGGAISNGGSIVRWLADTLAPDIELAAGDGDADAAVLALADDVPPGSDGLLMLPYVLPERAPLWDPELPAAYLGLRRAHTRGHLVRAAVEGVCLQLRVVLDGLARDAPVTVVRATGGVFRNAIWRDVMAAMAGRPLHVEDSAGGTALGAAALGLLALKRAASLADAAAQLGVNAAPVGPPVAVDPAAAAAYDDLRASVAGMVADLERATHLFGRR